MYQLFLIELMNEKNSTKYAFISIFVKPTQLTFGSHVYSVCVTGTVKDTIIVAMVLFRFPNPSGPTEPNFHCNSACQYVFPRYTSKQYKAYTHFPSYTRVRVTTTGRECVSPILITHAGDSRLIRIPMCIRILCET